MFEPRDTQRWEREIRALLARTATEGDPEAFAFAVELLDDARRQLAVVAGELRRQGYSWTDLAGPLGVTRSAAQQRFGPMAATATRDQARLENWRKPVPA